MPKRRTYKLTSAVNRVENEIESILRKRQPTRYFEGIVLMYSVMENVLKWLVFIKILWSKSDRVLRAADTESLRRFCNQQDFYSAMNLALVTELITHPLFRRIDLIRRE